MLSNTKYSFWWMPKPVTGRRSMRAQKGTPTEPYRNVMYDKRVVRGSNYGATSIELDSYNKAAEWRRRSILRKKVIMRNQRNVIGTPPPVIGRRHEVVQTEKYLEELLDHPPVRTTDTQTDLFLDRPPTPPFVKSKIGVDVGTAIEPGDLPPEEKSSADDISLIERFIEACITDTTQEIDLETVETTEIRQTTAPNLLGKFDAMEKDDHNIRSANQLKMNLHATTEEVTQIVNSNDILTVIIEEIVKQREEAYAAEIKPTKETDRWRLESNEFTNHS